MNILTVGINIDHLWTKDRWLAAREVFIKEEVKFDFDEYLDETGRKYKKYKVVFSSEEAAAIFKLTYPEIFVK